MTHALHLLVLDATWRPRHRIAFGPDWRTAVTGLLACDCRWVAIDQRRAPEARATPNSGDIVLTRALARRLRPLEMQLADHVIHAGQSRFSFRMAGLL
ncbi:MAG: hypothetical protein I8H86_10620 [Sphingomonadaceae bacterium]|nr:hypothetical protein [Sphingomonadaceae bacterium]MBH2000071.1 hypothetical protein [Sphingomonadaceae bacterium]